MIADMTGRDQLPRLTRIMHDHVTSVHRAARRLRLTIMIMHDKRDQCAVAEVDHNYA